MNGELKSVSGSLLMTRVGRGAKGVSSRTGRYACVGQVRFLVSAFLIRVTRDCFILLSPWVARLKANGSERSMEAFLRCIVTVRGKGIGAIRCELGQDVVQLSDQVLEARFVRYGLTFNCVM